MVDAVAGFTEATSELEALCDWFLSVFAFLGRECRAIPPRMRLNRPKPFFMVMEFL